MVNKDIRWMQRFDNFSRALSQLGEAVELSNKRELSKLEKQGLIQGFEFTHELAWKTMKDFLEEKGGPVIYGSKDAAREAFRLNLIENGEVWMRMIDSRNKSSHTYDQVIADEIVSEIIENYFVEFKKMNATFSKLKSETK